MARSHRFSTADLMALSQVPQALGILDETLDDEVRAKLASFAGSKPKLAYSEIKDGVYRVRAPLHRNFNCIAGYYLLSDTTDGYPAMIAGLDIYKGATGSDRVIAAMKEIARREDWHSYDLDSSERWAGVWRETSIASLLAEENHVEAAKRFFIESIHQLRDELMAFKKEHPDLPWNGGE